MEQHQVRRSELVAVFGYPGVAGAHRYRPPYPAEVFDVLERIMTDRPGTGLVRPHAVDGLLDLPVVADLAGGRITVTAAR